MRYELADYEWSARKPILPNKPRGVPQVARNLVERFFNRIKQCRRVATRYDRLAANYLAFVQLASIRLWLRLYESAS
jgi:transposase